MITLDTGVPTHPKFLAAGPAASWLYVCALCYCRARFSDGFVPTSALGFLGLNGDLDIGALADTLVRVGLWEPAASGFQIHDYLAHNKSSAEMRDLLTTRREAGQRGGHTTQRRKQMLQDVLEQAAEASAVADAEVSALAEALAVADEDERGGDENSSTLVLSTKTKNTGIGTKSEQLGLQGGDRNSSQASNVLQHMLANPGDTSPVLLSFPVVGGTTEWAFTEQQRQTWAALFPALDILVEARNALAWCNANPSRRKTRRGMKSFLVSWFIRSTDHPRQPSSAPHTRTSGNAEAAARFIQRGQK